MVSRLVLLFKCLNIYLGHRKARDPSLGPNPYFENLCLRHLQQKLHEQPIHDTASDSYCMLFL